MIMEQGLRDRILFAIHLDQAMSHYEGFYRESLEEEKERLIAIGKDYKRKERKAYEKKVDKMIKDENKNVSKFLKDNYRYLEQIENNMTEDSQDRLENLCVKVGELMELLMNNAHNEDINILLSLYKEGKLTPFLDKVKENLDKQTQDAKDN